MSFHSLYVIGHSLGGHVVGYTGKNVEKGRINTIYGLDPAGPLFSIEDPNERLANTDAYYVETIHTDIGKYGFTLPIGVTSFYPNNGNKQPGCSAVDDLFGCSHARAYEFFSESIIMNNFVPTHCKNFKMTKDKDCTETMKNIRMGGDPSSYIKKAKGIYYLSTNAYKPYGQGSPQ